MGASSSSRFRAPTEELAPMGRSYGVGLVSKPCGPSQVANTTSTYYGLPCWHHCPAWGCRI